MTTPRALQSTWSQHALALGLAALVTFGVLTGVVGEAGSDRAAELAQQARSVPQAVVTTLVEPRV
jgi:hypothetical protein